MNRIVDGRGRRLADPGGVATNVPFSEWGTEFPGPRLVAAIVDRATVNAHILEIGTQSYRLRTSKTSCAECAQTDGRARVGSAHTRRRRSPRATLSRSRASITTA